MALERPAQAANSPRSAARGASAAWGSTDQGESARFSRHRVAQRAAGPESKSLAFLHRLSGMFRLGLIGAGPGRAGISPLQVRQEAVDVADPLAMGLGKRLLEPTARPCRTPRARGSARRRRVPGLPAPAAPPRSRPPRPASGPAPSAASRPAPVAGSGRGATGVASAGGRSGAAAGSVFGSVLGHGVPHRSAQCGRRRESDRGGPPLSRRAGVSTLQVGQVSLQLAHPLVVEPGDDPLQPVLESSGSPRATAPGRPRPGTANPPAREAGPRPPPRRSAARRSPGAASPVDARASTRLDGRRSGPTLAGRSGSPMHVAADPAIGPGYRRCRSLGNESIRAGGPEPASGLGHHS